MGQPACKIAEANSEAQAKPRENSLQSETAIDASPLGQCSEAIKSLPSRRKDRINADGIDDLNLQALHQKRFSSPSPIVPPTVPSMAPGVGGFNIDPPAPRASLAKNDVAIAHARHRALPKPNLFPQAPIEAQRAAIVVEGEPSLVLNLFVIIAIAIVGVLLLVFSDETRKQLSDVFATVTPWYKVSSTHTSFHQAGLVVESQKGLVNEPLPLGISVKDASGVETVTVAGLATEAELSLGTSLGPAGWLVPTRDLDRTFVGAPEDFVGVMDATVTLRSAGGQLLDSKAIRFEWIQKKREGLEPTIGLPEPMPALPPLSPEQIAALIKLGQDLLKHGDIASARFLLKRAAIAGNPQAALELGLTFDRTFLTEAAFLGVAPDGGQAREWYNRAIKLGSTEASSHLERLSSLPK
jgi:hypothetical protein